MCVAASADKINWSDVKFLRPVSTLEDLPVEDYSEVAFMGRSNVGKSSLINFIFNSRKVAKTSSTPGRTQALNFFEVDKVGRFVDMPGYGYARAPKTLVETWTQLIFDYLKWRTQLQRVFLLVDARHGIKETDAQAMKMLDESGMSYQVILTKIDKLSESNLQAQVLGLRQQMSAHAAVHPDVLLSSVLKKVGRDDVRRAFVNGLLKFLA